MTYTKVENDEVRTLEDAASMSRCMMWYKARVKKDGDVDENVKAKLQELVSSIDYDISIFSIILMLFT
jgi:hypothetical protein